MAKPGLAFLQFIPARWARLVMGRQGVDQPAQDWRAVTDERDGRTLAALGLLRVGIDPDDAQLFVCSPMMKSEEQPRSDGENGIGFTPKLMPERERDAERIAGIEHTAAAAEGHDRRLQHLRQFRDLRGRILGASS